MQIRTVSEDVKIYKYMYILLLFFVHISLHYANSSCKIGLSQLCPIIDIGVVNIFILFRHLPQLRKSIYAHFSVKSICRITVLLPSPATVHLFVAIIIYQQCASWIE